MPRRLGAGLVKRPERRAAELELTGGLEADVAVHALQRDHLAVFEHRLPAEFGEAHQQVADAAGLVVAWRPVIGAAIDELLVLRADAPRVARLLAAGEDRQQIVAALDERTGVVVCARSHAPRLASRFY